MNLSLRSVSTCSVCLLALGMSPAVGGSAPQSPAPTRAAGAAAAPSTERQPATAPAAFDLAREERGLHDSLETLVRDLGYERLVREGRMAVAVVDLESTRPRYAALNGDRMMYAASLPKIAILAGAFDAIESGRLRDTPALRDEMTRMIRVSSNSAATSVLRRVGFENVARTLQSPAVRLYDPEKAGGLWVGKAYGKQQYWKRDPIASLSHGATARQTARFFAMLDRGLLISQRASRAMKEMLGNPGISHKFVRGLAAIPGAKIYRKSGTWRDYHADAALVERADARYVIVGLVRDADGGRVLERLAAGVDRMIRSAAPTAVASSR